MHGTRKNHTMHYELKKTKATQDIGRHPET
jgi:hypothetical protein